MKWSVDKGFSSRKLRYFIALEEKNDHFWRYLCFDTEIAEYFGISVKQYQKELKKFGAYKYRDTLFKNKDDAERALEFLKEKYGIISQLIK